MMSQEDGSLPYPKGFATAAIHHAQEPEKWDSMAIVTPIILSTTFKQDAPGEQKKFEYTRTGNPTRDVLENVLAKLDTGKHGLAFSAGVGAITAVLGLMKCGDHFIGGDDLYGGTNLLFTKIASKSGIEVTLVDFSDLSNFEKNIRSNTKLVFIETPTNPTTQVIDIKAVSAITKRYNLILVVDNTFLTPYLQRPLDLGADIVCYSMSKYMNGHTDVLMGAVVTSDEKLFKELRFIQHSMGLVPSPFDCYQVLRSLKTLALRMERHKKNSLGVAKYLESHPKVEKVLHPGLPSHPQHELFKSQTSGHSGTFSFYLKGDIETSRKFLTSLKLFTLAASLGGCESVVELPTVLSHLTVPAEQKAALGITDTLIRLSVGLEDAEYLIEDLEQVLNAL